MLTDYDYVLKKMHAYLCPAGSGVYAVTTGSQLRESLQKKLYGELNIQELWKKQIQNFSQGKDTVLLGICSDNGGGIVRGANWGPLFIRKQLYANVQEHFWQDIGDVRVIPQFLLDDYLNTETIKKSRKALYGDANSKLPVSPLSITMDLMRSMHQLFPQKKFMSLGGDHSITYGLAKPFIEAKQKQRKNIAVIHFDAHTDLLKERLGVEICFGSWAYHIAPLLKSTDHLVQIGLRASRKTKAEWEATVGVKQFWANEIHEQGVSSIADQIIKHLQSKNIDELYISFDIDVIDEYYVSATGTPESGGLTPEQAIELLQAICANFIVGGADLVEVAPFVASLDAKIREHEPASTLKVASAVTQVLLRALNPSARFL